MNRIWNLTKAITKYIASGGKNVSKEEYEKRLKECDTCPVRKGNTCGACGCFLIAKAKMKTENCPNNFWDEQK